MGIPMYQVDAFTGNFYSGNPSAVCPLTEWLPGEGVEISGRAVLYLIGSIKI